MSPLRLLADAVLCPYEPGHSANSEDLVSMKLDNVFKLLGSAPILTLPDLVHWIGAHGVQFHVHVIETFYDIPAMIDQSGIYRKWTSPMTCKLGLPFGIRQRPLEVYLVWKPEYHNDTKEWDERFIGNDAHFRFHEDMKIPTRPVPLLTKEYAGNVKPFPNIFQAQLKKEKPGLERTIYQNGLNVMNECYPNHKDAQDYWKEELNDVIDPPRYADKVPKPQAPEDLIFAQDRLFRTEQDLERIAAVSNEKEGSDVTCCKHLPFILPGELKKMARPQLRRLCNLHVEYGKHLSRTGKVDEVRLRIADHFRVCPHGPKGHVYDRNDMKLFKIESTFGKTKKRPRVYDLSGKKKKKKKRKKKKHQIKKYL